MMVISELRLTVTKNINLGNYNNVKIEVGAVVGRDRDDETVEDMRARILDEVSALMADATADHVPKRRERASSKDDTGGY